MRKVWLDDCRPMPADYDIHVYTAKEAICLVRLNIVKAISLDHDLGDESCGSGYEVAKWIEEAAFFNKIKRISWRIHSANPVGLKNMTMALEMADRFWTDHGK